jgi:hypothetical protein
VIKMRCGSGLGDSIYLLAIAEHFLRQGKQVTVKSDYPEVFADAGVTVERFARDYCNVVAHYSTRKACPETNQWQDIAINAGVPDAPLAINWQIKNRLLVNDLKAMANGKPIIMVNGGRPPMGRQDGYGYEMLPKRSAFDGVLAGLEDCFTVEVGKGLELYPLTASVDLVDRTSPADLMDIASISRALVGQCSFMIPLAEALDKPLMVVWAAAGLASGTQFIKQCTPQKIISKPATTRYVMDDWAPERIAEEISAFRRLFRSR